MLSCKIYSEQVEIWALQSHGQAHHSQSLRVCLHTSVWEVNSTFAPRALHGFKVMHTIA